MSVLPKFELDFTEITTSFWKQPFFQWDPPFSYEEHRNFARQQVEEANARFLDAHESFHRNKKRDWLDLNFLKLIDPDGKAGPQEPRVTRTTQAPKEVSKIFLKWPRCWLFVGLYLWPFFSGRGGNVLDCSSAGFPRIQAFMKEANLWITEARAHAPNDIVPEETREEFVNWIATWYLQLTEVYDAFYENVRALRSKGRSPELENEEEIRAYATLRRKLYFSILSSAKEGFPRILGGLEPYDPWITEDLEEEYFYFTDLTYGRLPQLLGHGSTSSHVGKEEKHQLLLHFPSDDALLFSIGDVSSLEFWITPEALENHNLDSVIATYGP